MSQSNAEMDFYPTRLDSESKIISRTDPVVYPSSFSSLSEEQEKFFEKNGYLIFDNLFTSDEVSALFEELKSMSEDSSKKDLPQFILEESNKEVRSIFEIHKLSELYGRDFVETRE